MDVGIDTKTSFDRAVVFPCAIQAAMVVNIKWKVHPAGSYFQQMPTDPVTKLAAIPYDKAGDLGFFKVDFLHLSLLDFFDSKEEIRTLLKVDPDWSMLTDRDTVEQLFQIRNNFDLVNRIRPTNITELADCIALIRPGKRHLVEAYIKDKDGVRQQIYEKTPTDQYAYKRSHAIAYAHNVVLQMHLIKGGVWQNG